MGLSLATKSVGLPDESFKWYLHNSGEALATGFPVCLGDGTETPLWLDEDGVGFRNSGGFTTSFRCEDATADQELVIHYTAGAGKLYPEIIAVLAADLANSTVTAAAVTGFTAAVVANGLYEFEMLLVFKSALTTTSPRFRVTGPSAQTTWVTYRVEAASNVATADFIPTSGPPTADTPYVYRVKGMAKFSGSTPATPIGLDIWSEVATSEIRLMAGSVMKLRKLN
jgi:hypothetical protein